MAQRNDNSNQRSGASSRGPGQRKGPASQMGQQGRSDEPTTQDCQQPAQQGPRGASDNPVLQNAGASMKSSDQRGGGKGEPDLGRGTPSATQHGQQMFEKGQPGQMGQGTVQGKGHQGQQAHQKSQSSDKGHPSSGARSSGSRED